MTSLNLTQRIWLSFSLLVLLVGIVIAVVYPLSIQGALREQTYNMIERQQQLRYGNPNFKKDTLPRSEAELIKRRDAARSVESFLFIPNHGELKGNPVLKEMSQQALHQDGQKGQYDMTYQGATLFYVVSKVNVYGQNAFLISYMWDTYVKEMIQTLWVRLLWVLLIAGLLGLGLALWLARYLRQPLVILGNRFEEISHRNWQSSFRWEKDDEFGRLSGQFEKMRQNLVRYDHSQKTFIQHASHELKTPIMIINSYAQSVKDGIMPKDNLQDTMDVIVDESNRMDQRVKELIYYTKLDTLKDETPHRDQIKIGPVAEDVVDRLRVQREDLDFDISGKDTEFYVDREQCQVLIENLVENALRYAESEIHVNAESRGWDSILSVYNDGDAIPEEERAHLFDPFYKGTKGKFGLGLAIVMRIVELHHGKITVENENDGVRFIAKFPNQS